MLPNQPWNIEECDGTADVYPAWPDDWEAHKNFQYEIVEKAVLNIKESGNYYFKNKNYTDAARKYIKTLRYIDWYKLHNSNFTVDKIENIRITSILNLAASKLKTHNFREVIELCDQVLTKKKCTKAFYRRAQAYMAMTEYEKAMRDLNAALSMEPDDLRIRNALEIVRKLKMDYLIEERKNFSKMFQ